MVVTWQDQGGGFRGTGGILNGADHPGIDCFADPRVDIAGNAAGLAQKPLLERAPFFLFGLPVQGNSGDIAEF